METKLLKYLFVVVLGIFISFSLKSQDIYMLNSTISGTSISTCNAVLYDSGGPNGNYPDNENFNITFCSPLPGIPLNIEIVSFNSESTSFDYMHIYDGINSNVSESPRIVGPIGGRPAPQQGTTYTTTGDCVHITWRSDVSSNYAGFEIHISCAIPCQDFSFAAIPGSPLALTNVYLGESLTFGVAGTYPDSGTYYDQTDDSLTWEWQIVAPNPIYNTTIRGVGMSELTYSFDRVGTYYITVKGIDIILCEEIITNMWVINVTDQVVLDNVANGETYSSCGGTLTDSGGESGLHGLNENYTTTICGDFMGSIPRLTFSEFDLALGAYLTVYDGIGTSGAILLNQASGNTIPQLPTGTQECITIVWHSGNTTPAGNGFLADISCQRLECQPFSIAVSSTTPPLATTEYVVTRGTVVDFVVSGQYPNQVVYPQSDANTVWTWEFYNGMMPPYIIDGVGLSTLSYTFLGIGEYNIIVRAVDANGCQSEPIYITVTVPNTLNLDSQISGQTIIGCGAVLYDSGGPNSPYGHSQDYNITFCNPFSGSTLNIDIVSFNTESCCDYVYIYDAPNANSGSILLNRGLGTAPTGSSYTTTGECVHITWHSDGSVNNTGFEINIDCNIPCQDYSIDIVNTTPTVSDNSEININTVVEFTAEGIYPNSGAIYEQSDDNITWTWKIISPSQDTAIFLGLGINFLTYSFDEHGVYTLLLSASDINDCEVDFPEWTINVLPHYPIDIRDGNTIYACYGTIFDSGGEDGVYGLGEDYSITVCSDFPGSTLHFDFSVFDVSTNAYVTIYDGVGTSGNILLNNASGNRLPPQTTSTGECMTLVWHSGASGVQAEGFAAEISCTPPPCQEFSAAFENMIPYLPSINYTVSIGTTVNFNGEGVYPNQLLYPQDDASSIWRWEFDNGSADVIEGLGLSNVNYTFASSGDYVVTLVITDANGCESSAAILNVSVGDSNNLNSTISGTTITTCNSTLYDSGGPNANYGNYEDYTVTYCSPIPGTTLLVELEQFVTESVSWDYMTPYDGANNGGTMLVTERTDGRIGGTHTGRTFNTTGECVHLVWHTDGSGVYAGFKINISCNSVPCQEYSVDISSTDPSISNNSQIYINTNLAFTASGTYPNDGQYYAQNDNSINWIWEITSPSGRSETINRIGNSMINYNFTHGGEYLIRVIARDMYGCEAISEYWTIVVLPVYKIDDEIDGNTIYTCNATIYDSGGESGNYSDNEDYVATFCSEFAGSRVRLDFVGFGLVRGDLLSIYDGMHNYGVALLPETTGSRIPHSVTSLGECVTIHFHSDESNNNSGYEIALTCIPPECEDFLVYIVGTEPSMSASSYRALEGTTVSFTGEGTYNTSGAYLQSDETSYWEWVISGGGVDEEIRGFGLTTISYTFANEGDYQISVTVTDANGCSAVVNNPMSLEILSNDDVREIDPTTNNTTIRDCGFLLYDSGGANGNYGNSENYTVVICNPSETGNVSVDILEFETENSYDYMNIYDGVGIGDTILLNRVSGNRIAPHRVVSDQQCITITWYSNGSTAGSGFEMYVDCVDDCQPFSIIFPEYPEGDTLPIDVCKNTIVPFTVNGVYPQNNTNYYQSDENIIWEWQIEGEEEFKISGRGMNTFQYQFNNPGGYFVNVVGTDENGCKYEFSDIILDDKFVRVALDPVFSGTRITDTVCPGYVVDMMGFYQVEPWQFIYVIEIVDTTCMGDNMRGIEQIYDFEQIGFEEEIVISSVDDIEYIQIAIEHSYIGDLDLFLRCPPDPVTGIRREMYLIEYPSCGGGYLGEPIDVDAQACEIGVPYIYTWSPSAIATVQQVCPGGGTPLPPSVDYAPTDPWTSLIGCPLNGDWEVVLVDNLTSDDGTVISAGFRFAEYIYQEYSAISEWAYTNTYSNFSWSGDGIQSNGIRATAIPTISGDREYNFSMIDDFGCSHDTTLVVHVRPVTDPDCCITPEASAGATLDTTVCADVLTFQFRASLATGNTGRWTVIDKPAGAPDPIIYGTNSPNARVEVSQDGFYEFQWTEYYAGVQSCFASDIIRVEFRTRPTSVFNNPPILCYGDTITFTYRGNIDEYTTADYSWDFAGGRVISGSGRGPQSVVWENVGDFDISLRVSAYGCSSDITTVTLANPPQLKHVLTVEDNSCYNSCDGKARLNVSGGTYPYRYSWASPTNVLSNICAGDYQVTITDRNGCFVSEDFSVEHPEQLVIVDTSYTNLTCYNSNDGIMEIIVSGGVGEYTYIWSDIGVADSLRTNVPAGNYTVIVKDANDCSVSTQFTLTQPEELITIASPDINICQGAFTFVDANTVGGVLPYVYNWKSGTNGQYFIDGLSILAQPDTTTAYSVYVTDAHGCTSNIASMTVYVSPTLVIDSLIVKDNSCNASCNGKAAIYLSGGVPPFRYSWDSDNYIYDGLCAGTYFITVSDLFGCKITTPFAIAEPDPIVYTKTMIPATCYGYSDGSTTINVSGGTPPYSYLWPEGETESTLTALAGNYTVTVLDANNCRIEVEHTIEQPSKMNLLSIPDRSICIGESTRITTEVSGGTPDYEFVWTDESGTETYLKVIEVRPEVATVYTLQVYDANGCATVPITATVNINPELKINSVSTSNHMNCPGDDVQVEVNVTGGNGGPYFMTLQDGTIVGSTFVVNPLETTTYYITLEDMCNSPKAMDSITVNVRPSPIGDFITENLTGCPPFTVLMNESSELEFDYYIWRFGDDGYSENRNPVHTFNETGVFDVSLEVRDDFGCKHIKTIHDYIRVLPTPKASFEMTPGLLRLESMEIQFENHSTSAENYYWSFGDGDSSLYMNPSHEYEDLREYEVSLIAENEYGCSDTITRILEVSQAVTFYMPTLFSPNGDGVNDCFRPCGSRISPENFRLVVQDRWGNIVYTTTKYDPDVPCKQCSDGAWDGTHDGLFSNSKEYLPNGSYIWTCEFQDLDGITYRREGSISLAR